jgi:hypothetical protein
MALPFVVVVRAAGRGRNGLKHARWSGRVSDPYPIPFSGPAA